MRSHPPSLLKIFGRVLREECKLAPGTRLLAAVSGGADSTALLHVLSRSFPSSQLIAVGVDHGLRAEASAELAAAASFSEELGIEFVITRVRLQPGGNMQARAREARYAALEAIRRERSFDLIATAHHADDRAETVLLRILSGATPASLAVLPIRDGVRFRPLIRASKQDILRHLNRHGIAHSEDPSNRDARFLRARVRHEVMPLLKELSPAIVEHLNALANELEAEPLPELKDATGEPVRLKRAQRNELRRALWNRSTVARVLLSGNRVATFDRTTGRLRVDPAAPQQDDQNRHVGDDLSQLSNKALRGAKNPKSG